MRLCRWQLKAVQMEGSLITIPPDAASSTELLQLTTSNCFRTGVLLARTQKTVSGLILATRADLDTITFVSCNLI